MDTAVTPPAKIKEATFIVGRIVGLLDSGFPVFTTPLLTIGRVLLGGASLSHGSFSSFGLLPGSKSSAESTQMMSWYSLHVCSS